MMVPTNQLILEACRAIVKNGCGALIVIEQSQQLDQIELSGVAIDKELTQELLVEIFASGSELHDGAVLVRGNRVVAASCALPIVPRAIAEHRGLRHRAAIETTALYDATIYVVSQQRGTVAIVENQRLDYIQ